MPLTRTNGRFLYPIKDGYCIHRPVLLSLMPHDVVDTGDRPVLECRSGRFLIHEHDYAQSAFKDCRASQAKIMNVGAMKQWSQHENQAISWMQQVLHVLLRIAPGTDPKILCHWGIYACYRAPLKWILEADISTRVACVVPSPVSAASKVAQALQALNIYSAGTSGNLFLYPDIPGEEIYAYANQTNLLRGDKECCPASQSVIVKSLGKIFSSSALNDSSCPQRDEDKVIQVTFLSGLAAYIAFLYDLFRIRWNKVNRAEEPLLRSRYGHPFSVESLNTASENKLMESRTYQFYAMLMVPILGYLQLEQEISVLQKSVEELFLFDTATFHSAEFIQSYTLSLLNRVNSSLGELSLSPSIDLEMGDLKLIFGEIGFVNQE